MSTKKGGENGVYSGMDYQGPPGHRGELGTNQSGRCTLRCSISVPLIALTALILVLLLAVLDRSSLADLDRQRHFEGIEYNAIDDGKTHVVTIDLTNPNVHFDLATASNATGPNPPSWNAGMRQTVAEMAEAHCALDGLPLIVAMTGDYGASNGSHGWEGFMVRQGKRMDGPNTNAPDCDCTPFDRSALALSRSHPIRVEIAKHTPAELDQYEAYNAVCAGARPFQGCEKRVLDRTPDENEAAEFQAKLKDQWYTVVGGGPIIISDGVVISISEACRNEGFSADWCAENLDEDPTIAADRLRQLRMGAVAGVSRDGQQLILIVTTARLPNELSEILLGRGAYTGIRFDGSESSQIWYGGIERTGNTRRISNALLVYSKYTAPNGAIVIDDVQDAFKRDGPASLWQEERCEGWDGHFFWTLNNPSTLQNTAHWSLDLEQSGEYEILVYIPPEHATTTKAQYIIHHAGEVDTVEISQAEHRNEWVSLGTFAFSGEEGEFVFLGDATGEQIGTTHIAFDAAAYVLKRSSRFPWWKNWWRAITEWFDALPEKIRTWWENWKQEQIDKLIRRLEEEFNRWLESQCASVSLPIVLSLLATILCKKRKNHNG